MPSSPISLLYLKYKQNLLSKSDLEGQIFSLLLDNRQFYRFFRGNPDQWEDFVSWLYPRFSKAIDLYRDNGSSLDAYFLSIIKRASKEYRTREADHKITEYVCWFSKAEEMQTLEDEAEYHSGEYHSDKHLKEKDIHSPLLSSKVKPKYLLYLLLKSYYFVSDDILKQVAAVTGLGVDAVSDMVLEIKKRRRNNEDRLLSLKERLHLQHYRCLSYQKRMEMALQGTDYKNIMKDRLERARRRFASMKLRLSKMRLTPSNRLVADVLGIPKGTVDSGLYYLKKQLAYPGADNHGAASQDTASNGRVKPQKPAK